MQFRQLFSVPWVAADLIFLAPACLTLAWGGSASAQVRLEPSVASTISADPSKLDRALFGPDGYFLIAGGVVLQGSARFAVELGDSSKAVAASAVTPVVEQGGGMALRVDGHDYHVGMPPGMLCPLAHFMQRDGLIAYTVLRYMNETSPRLLMHAGLARHRIAREFDGTGFEPLLRAADFGETAALPNGVGQSLAASINASNGIGAFMLSASAQTETTPGSFINSDLQVTYKVYLMSDRQRVEIAGVPLRYYWELDNEGKPGVFSVEALAQNWGPDAKLSDWSVPGARPTQYDVVNFYQVAGLMRQLHVSAPEAFGRFADQACAGTSL